MQKITKAVIAAAGFGTRFLPQTKAMPKEMLPLIDKPIIQYVVEELVSVGIEDIVIVTGQNKRSLEDHFDKPNEDLIANLKAGGKSKSGYIEMLNAIGNMANFVYIRQKGPYGNGTPLLNAEHIIGNEPFIFTFSDDFIRATPPRFQQMIDIYNRYQRPVMSVIEVENDDAYDKYGFAGGPEIAEGIIEVNKIVEKPGKKKAPSNLASVSGYLLTPDFFGYLHQSKNNLEPGEELYSNSALKRMIDDNKRVIACCIQNGRYFDAGNKLEYLKANIELALEDKELRKPLIEFIHKLETN